MKPLILFDIDRTLLDTSRLVESHNLHLIKRFGLSAERLEEVHKKYKSTLKAGRYFRPKNYAKLIADSFGLELDEVVKESFTKSEHYIPFLETIEVLERLHKTFALGIWTEGVKSFQSLKIKYLNLDQFIRPDHKYIFLNKTTKNSLSKIPEKAIIIDDKVFNIDYLVKNGKHTPVWINRLNDDKHPKATTVKSLFEFEKWLHKKFKMTTLSLWRGFLFAGAH